MKERIEHIKTLLEDRQNHGKARELIDEITAEVGAENLPITILNFIDYLNGV